MKSAMVLLRLTEKDKRQLEQEAEGVGLGLQDYIRMMLKTHPKRERR